MRSARAYRLAQSMNRRLMSMGFRVFGAPPPRGAPLSERLRWVRRFYLRLLPVFLALYAVAVVYASSTWVWVLLAGTGLLWLQGLASLTIRIRRERDRDRP